ncbi:hypothetical protein [Hydrocarboniphaga effusa]|uniref:hypothetical protein n=1 Tax=Hydrocarboniphaga effusa TaxID=243629 RepID=UPI003BA92BEE
MKWFKALSFEERTQLAREFGLVLFRAGLYIGWGVVFAGIFLDWKWDAYAAGLAVAADLVFSGLVLTLYWGCRKNPADSDTSS